MLITNVTQLEKLVQQATKQGYVAIDTEFVWEKTFYPGLGIVQLGLSQEQVYIIDTLALQNLTPLKTLITDPNTTKIFHDAIQDLKILKRACSCQPHNIFDTRLAAGFAGSSSNISLANLLKEKINIELAKTHTRTNWLKRPLDPEQLTYALDDVRYMPKLYKILIQEMKQKNHYQWFQEDSEKLNQQTTYQDPDAKTTFQKIKGSGKFKPQELAILRELYCWREKQAEALDYTRRLVMHDAALMALVARTPRTPQDLQGFKALKGKKSAYIPQILQAINNAINLPKEQYPKQKQKTHHNNNHKINDAKVKKLKNYITEKCKKTNLDPSLISNRADLDSIVANYPTQNHNRYKVLNGWRKTFIGTELLDILATL